MKGNFETIFKVLSIEIENKELANFSENLQKLSVEELQLIKENIAHLESAIKKMVYSLDSSVRKSNGETQYLVDSFILKVYDVLEENYKNPRFGVEDLSAALLLSRSQLFRKLKTLTSTTPNNFIRSYRLSKAKELLLEEDQNATNVSYQTGFNNPNYFFKCFKDEYGMTPGQYLESLK